MYLEYMVFENFLFLKVRHSSIIHAMCEFLIFFFKTLFLCETRFNFSNRIYFYHCYDLICYLFKKVFYLITIFSILILVFEIFFSLTNFFEFYPQKNSFCKLQSERKYKFRPKNMF